MVEIKNTFDGLTTELEDAIRNRLLNGFQNWNGGETGAHVIEDWVLSDTPIS